MAVTGSIVVTTSKDGPLSKYSCAWTSDAAAGTVTECPVTLPAGRIVQAVCTPGGVTPSDDYDVSLLPASGETDLLSGGGTNMSNSLVNYVGCHGTDGSKTYLPVWISSGSYWPTVAAAGNSKTGVIDFYVA
jgi:hypothetical protein